MNHCLAIDIGGTFIKYGLIDQTGLIMEQGKEKTPPTIEEFWQTLESIISSYQDSVSGLAIACPGNIDTQNDSVKTGGLIPYLRNIPLGQRLMETFALPVEVLNDADAAGLAEAKTGTLKNCHCGAVLVLGTGVGLALVSDGQLVNLAQLPGKDFFHGPLATVEAKETSKPLQDLGQILGLHWRGIKSLVANSGSAVQFIRQASHQLALEQEDGKEVFHQLESGQDSLLQESFTNYCKEIAYLIVNLCLLLQLETLAIGGGISQQERLIEGINQAFDEIVATEQLNLQLQPNFKIQACRYQNEANLLGAFYHFQETV
ncbi:TPA: ROK family protein [Streptococcus suis]